MFPVDCAQLFRVARQKLRAMWKKLENFPLNFKCYSENLSVYYFDCQLSIYIFFYIFLPQLLRNSDGLTVALVAATFDLSATSVVALFPFAMVKVEHLFVCLLNFKTYYLSVCQSIYTSACKLRTFRSPPKLLAMMTLMNLTSSCCCCSCAAVAWEANRQPVAHFHLAQRQQNQLATDISASAMLSL